MWLLSDKDISVGLCETGGRRVIFNMILFLRLTGMTTIILCGFSKPLGPFSNACFSLEAHAKYCVICRDVTIPKTHGTIISR